MPLHPQNYQHSMDVCSMQHDTLRIDRSDRKSRMYSWVLEHNMTHNQILGCGFLALIAFTMPDHLKKYKLTCSVNKKRKERTEKWKRLREETKAKDEWQEEPENDENSMIHPPPLRRSCRFNKQLHAILVLCVKNMYCNTHGIQLFTKIMSFFIFIPYNTQPYLLRTMKLIAACISREENVGDHTSFVLPSKGFFCFQNLTW